MSAASDTPHAGEEQASRGIHQKYYWKASFALGCGSKPMAVFVQLTAEHPNARDLPSLAQIQQRKATLMTSVRYLPLLFRLDTLSSK